MPLPSLEVSTWQRTPHRFADWRFATNIVLGFWAIYAVTVVARALLSTDPVTILENRLVTVAAGIVLTAALYGLIAWLAPGPSLRRKSVVAAVGSILAAIALTATLLATEDKKRDSRESFRYQAREGFVVIQQGQKVRIERGAADPVVLTMPRLSELHQREQLRIAADTSVVWFFFFAAWSAVYLAAVSQRQTLALQRRAAAAESAAQLAQVRALRYQVNPHFLFNTLNSLSSLIIADRAEEAEAMILKLSNFYRSSLSLDPTADVTLDEEIALQRLYLDIEKVRFPRRLKVEIDVPEPLGLARLPVLLLQPIVENAIKYGLGATRDKVVLRIVAEEPLPGRLRIEITNVGAPTRARREGGFVDGIGVGLANVAQRLEARFGERASLSHGPLPEGGYRVVLTMPSERGE